MIQITKSDVSLKREKDGQYNMPIYRLAGYSGIAIAIGYIFITIEYMVAGPAIPTNAIEWTTYLDNNSTIWWSIIWTSIITNLLYLPVVYGLYLNLKNTNRTIILISGTLFTLFVFLELAITWSNYPTLLELVSKYKLAANDTQKTIYLSGIEFASTEFQTPITAFYTIFIPAIAAILASCSMFKSKIFGKLIAYIGLISGICNAFSVLGGFFYKPFGKLVIAGSFLILFWFLGIGIYFLKLKQEYKTL
jgi:hypothetical protein